jgi:ATP-dependent DNA helicase RecG
MYRFIATEVASGGQVFVVCPEINERHGADGARGVASVERMYKEYKRAFPEFSIGMAHGKTEPEARERTLRQLRENNIQLLIATTIIEVGVDVPNASVIVVEDADRFGLAQLHQLRGRVGRAQRKSHCFLLAEPTTPEAEQRLDIMTSTNDGFRIAEHDLMLRGPGEFLGAAQSGAPPLRVAHLVRDADLLEQAREVASAICKKDVALELPEHRLLRNFLTKRRTQTVQI